MRGVRAISDELGRIVEALPASEYPAVIDAALRLTANDHACDADIQSAIDSYRIAPGPSPALAEQYRGIAKESDEQYIAFEEQGKAAESLEMFKKMCVFNGLTALLAAPELSSEVVDNLIYDVGYGATSIDAFATAMIEEATAIASRLARESPQSAEIHLPLWTDDETDVRPEYHLSFGHLLCDMQLDEPSIQVLAKYLDLGALEYAGSIDLDRLPIHPRVGCRNLGSLELANILVARNGSYSVLFGPHKLFFNNTRWIKWNKKIGGLMVPAHRQSLTETSYNVFENGKRLLSAWAEGNQIRCREDPEIVAYLNGKQISCIPGAKPNMSEAIAALLRADVHVAEAPEGIHFARVLSGEPIADVVHFSFKARRRWLRFW